MGAREVPLRTKVAYGVADVAVSAKNTSLNQFLLFFYADVVRLSPSLVGAVLFVGKLWDAVVDPLVGYASDATRSRWGRRRPYVLASAVPVGVGYYLLFSPPVWQPAWLIPYVTVVNLALFTAFTVLAIPYLAWGAELARDYHERTTVVQIRSLFGVLGGVLGAVAPIWIATQYADQRIGFSRMAVALGLVMTGAALVTAFGVADRQQKQVPAASWAHFVRGLGHTFHNRDFTIIFATFCLMTVSGSLGQAIQLLVIKYWLNLYDFFPWIALTFGLSFAGSFPLWLGLSHRIGKHRALMGGLALGCVAPFGWIVVQPGQRWAMLVFMLAAGAVTGSLTLAMSQAADIVELDELRTGERRAGAYFGIWALGLKTMNALGTLLGGLLLDFVGYVPDRVQDPRTLWWLVVLVGPLQAGVHVVGLIVLRRIRVEAADVMRMQAELDARRAATPTVE